VQCVSARPFLALTTSSTFSLAGVDSQCASVADSAKMRRRDEPRYAWQRPLHFANILVVSAPPDEDVAIEAIRAKPKRLTIGEEGRQRTFETGFRRGGGDGSG
jgi:hypothetical protein